MKTNPSLNIAFLNKELPSDRPNGVSCQVDRLADALCSRGHRVTVYSFSPRPANATYGNVSLTYTATMKLLCKFLPAMKYRRVATSLYDIVHYHGDDYLSKGDSRRFRTFYGSAVQEAIHAKTIKRFLYQALFYFFEIVSASKSGTSVGISRNTQKCIPHIRHVIPCGVPTRKYIPGTKKADHPTILFLGDLDSRKRGRLLVNIFQEHILPIIPDCEMRVAGPQEITGPHITYLGTIDEALLIEEYQKAWVYCFPSSYEGFGVPAIEAMACETAVVCTKNPGITDIITDGSDGMITTPDKLASTVIKVLTNDDLRTRLAHAGRKTSVARFDTDTLAAQYETLYLRRGAAK